MKYAIVEVSGKQYHVEEEEEVEVDRMEGKEGDKVKFDQVLLVRDGEEVEVGNPVVVGVVVGGEIVGQEKGKKVRVAKYQAKTGYRRVYGFRASLTRVRVDEIGGGKKKGKVKRVKKA